MFYKPSMFNHICDMDNEMILYNSLKGCKESVRFMRIRYQNYQVL